MKKLIVWHFSLGLFILSSCNQTKPEWLTELDHVTSPDGKAIIYQESFPADGGFRTSVVTWISTPRGSGGSGVFDLQSVKPLSLVLTWTSDSTALIQYDSTATILRMETEAYFFGRRTTFSYQTKN